ncbi:hypothetical protein CAPTEDRAFT_196483 [Capitella teleta]|uniref:Uncharacterized protein n=1 Tax=Capitella teleta TaxID=283909 RepID=R7V3H4_CAPTE|nr:hypothetical protein CAPTEDRAFT_196483 [Capitella teleta]|eukprot:ELU13398.1 hypothetical protein CAPTEDRAFT_196483 [Capitella teleta]
MRNEVYTNNLRPGKITLGLRIMTNCAMSTVMANEKCPEYEHVVTFPRTSGVILAHSVPKFSWCYTVWAAVGLFLCPVFGFVALIASLSSYTDHNVKDFIGATGKRRVACIFGVTGVVVVRC